MQYEHEYTRYNIEVNEQVREAMYGAKMYNAIDEIKGNNEIITVEVIHISHMIKSLIRVQGLYVFHTCKAVDGILYIGKADNFSKRFKGGYLNQNEKKRQYVNKQLAVDILFNMEGWQRLYVDFIPLPNLPYKEVERLEKELIKINLPRYNVRDNPLNETASIHHLVRQTIKNEMSNYTFDDMATHLYCEWNCNIPYEKIFEAISIMRSCEWCKVDKVNQMLEFEMAYDTDLFYEAWRDDHVDEYSSL